MAGRLAALGTSAAWANAVLVAWALAGAYACASVIGLEPNMLEEGLILEIAQRILRGDRLYQDVVAFTGPLPFESLALLFRLFGEEIAVGRTAVVVLHGLATASVYGLALHARVGVLAHAAAAAMASAPLLLFPLFSIFFYTTLSFSVCLLAGYATLRGTRSVAWAVAAGVLIAASALCKQTVGLMLAIALLAALALCTSPERRVRQSLALILGGSLAAITTLAAYAATGGLGALIESLIYLPMTFESSFNSPFMNFWPPGEFDPAIKASQPFYIPYFFAVEFGLWYEPAAADSAHAGTICSATAGDRRDRCASDRRAVAIGDLDPPRSADRADDEPVSAHRLGHLVFVLPSSLAQLVLLAGFSRGDRVTRWLAAPAALVLVGVLAVGSYAISSYYHGVASSRVASVRVFRCRPSVAATGRAPCRTRFAICARTYSPAIRSSWLVPSP